MNRFISWVLISSFGFCASGGPALATAYTANLYANRSILTETVSPYQNVVLQMYQASYGTAPTQQTLTNLENALSAAHAPTDVAGITAAYSTNAAVKSIIDSMGTNNSGLSTAALVTNIYMNVTGHVPQVSGLTFWTNAINSGTVTIGDAALSILAAALDNNSAVTAITQPKVTVAVDPNTVSTVNTELAAVPSSSANPIVSAIQNHPIVAAVVATTVIATAIAVSVAVPLGVNAIHQNDNQTKINQMNTQAAIYVNQNIVKSQQVVPVVTSSGGGSSDSSGGYQPP